MFKRVTGKEKYYTVDVSSTSAQLSFQSNKQTAITVAALDNKGREGPQSTALYLSNTPLSQLFQPNLTTESMLVDLSATLEEASEVQISVSWSAPVQNASLQVCMLASGFDKQHKCQQ